MNPKQPSKLPQRALTILTALSLLAALLAWLAPWAWPFEMLAEFRSQFRLLAAITVALTLFAKIPRASKLANLTLATAAIALQTLALAPWDFPSPNKATQADLTFLQANLCKRNSDPKLSHLLSQKADILALFEVSNLHQTFLEDAAKTYPHHLRNKDIVVLSRWPLKRLPLERPDERIDLMSIETPSGKLQLGLVHPTIPLGPIRTSQRDYVLNKMAVEVGRLTGPKLLVGDFNTTNFSHAFAEVERLSGCRDTARGQQHQGTWHAKLWPPLRIPLDHVLASPELQVHSKRNGPNIGSDHLPVITTLKILTRYPVTTNLGLKNP